MPSVPTTAVSIAFYRLLHPERSVTGSNRVILVGKRSPKQGHDTVAHNVIDRALEPVNGLHHLADDGIE